jgi:hypothetical protein
MKKMQSSASKKVMKQNSAIKKQAQLKKREEESPQRLNMTPIQNEVRKSFLDAKSAEIATNMQESGAVKAKSTLQKLLEAKKRQKEEESEDGEEELELRREETIRRLAQKF